MVIATDISLSGTYTINVGKGGDIGVAAEDGLSNGNNSEIFSGNNYSTAANKIRAYGGGGGGHEFDAPRDNGNNGGNGGGGHTLVATGGTTLSFGGSVTPAIKSGIFSSGISYGNAGGTGGKQAVPSNNEGGGGGGGCGVGQVGGTGLYRDNPDTTVSLGGKGGAGLYIGNIFGDNCGVNGWVGGGGGGGSYAGGNTLAAFQDNIGGQGGGGEGGRVHRTGTKLATHGINGTGGGGGGGAYASIGGKGGAGIVIIRFKKDIAGFLNTLQTSYVYDNNKDNAFDKKSNFDLSIESSNTIRKNVLTAFVFLETGYYKFQYSLLNYNRDTVNLKILIYNNNDKGLPTTVTELDNSGKQTFVSKGGFYKIAFCYNLYNNTGSTIQYSFNFEAKYSFTNISSDSGWKDISWLNMNDYLNTDNRLYVNLFNRTTDDNKYTINNLFRNDYKNFRGYTSKLNPGHDVYEILKKEILNIKKPTGPDAFNIMYNQTAKDLYETERQELEDRNKYSNDSEIKYINAISTELATIDYPPLFGVQASPEVLLYSPATSYIVSHGKEIPSDFITYSGINTPTGVTDTRPFRTPANMKDTTFDIINNATKTIYIEEIINIKK
jgi:hypothetical protein